MIQELFKQFSDAQFVTFLVFIGSWLLLLLLFLLSHFRLALTKNNSSPTNTTPVSLVICAKNEAENLLTNIPHIMSQDYPEFEVVVVNDSSWDNTEDILKAFSSQHPNLKVLNLNEDIQRMTGKKFALTMGIKATKYETLLLTDADCKPLDKTWIRDMVKTKGDSGIVLGVSLLNKEKGLLKNLFRFESFLTAVTYLSFAKLGKPYMGVGRNLLYDKSLFFEVGGFKKHMHIAGGDDDLFINEVATKKNTTFTMEFSAQTSSDSSHSLKEWWTQKKRHLYASKFYKTRNKALLGLEPLLWWVMCITAIMLFILRTPPLLLLIALFLRYILVSATFISLGRRWKALDAIWLWPIWEVLLNIMRPMVLVSNKISKPKTWRM